MGTTLIPPEVPVRVPDRAGQQFSALDRANVVKRQRAALLHRMYLLSHVESCRMAADVMEEVPDVLLSMELGKFLERVRKSSRAHAGERRCAPSAAAGRGLSRSSRRWLSVSGTHERLRLCELSLRQRAMLAAALRFSAESAS